MFGLLSLKWMVKLMKEVILTPDEAKALVEYFALYFIQNIQQDNEIDCIEWIGSLCDIYRKCLEARKE